MMTFTYRGADGCPLHATTVGSTGAPLVLLHGGGPDHHSLLPLAHLLADRHTVILPDVRGYGRSVCADPALHTWDQYVSDVVALLDHLDLRVAALGGTGLGATVALRAMLAHPERVRAAVLIGVEDIEDDQDKEAETAFLDAFAARVRTDGVEAAWTPILEHFPPVIGAMVRDAIPRSDPASIAAAAAIGHDRSFRDVGELAAITTPTLVVPGTDARHPTELAERVVRVLGDGHLAPVSVSADLHTADDLASAIAPALRAFLAVPR
ncbi:alpha/beta fold hydrolase [Streptosporangium saharense]|uniref:Pimeloyl-ACP methyl ester carboxylesterase n=1 Tax=Streptosporangium saharense TaxID=1706840 RepID=A0A7W7QQK9_9ACTN|nr:alpha/beta hydrolase [Streptosporangium saharense]MBB4917779.1 pimeloyl-ACP methyl ester carboxylesterase [Streptosporangium saharense]